VTTKPHSSGESEVLEQARRQFLAVARGTVDAFAQLGEQLAARPDAAELLTPLRRELHRLNGSAATFGFPRLGRMAAALESAVKKWAADPQLDRDRRAPIVTRFTKALEAEVATDGEAPAMPMRRLLIVGLRDVAAVPLTTEASARGYQVERVRADELDEALEDGVPHAVIAAIGTPGLDELAGVARLMLRQRSAADASPPPAGARVLDVRTEPSEVLDALAQLATKARVASAGAIAVDDDPVMRTLVQLACEHLNLGVNALATPEAFMAAVSGGEAALLVIDIELGTANGLDLVRAVRAVRALPAHRRTPILVLSGHADAKTRDAAVSAGADDYMLKPFAPAEFQRRVGALFDAKRRRLASEGVHAESGVTLPSRTMRDLDAELSARRADTASIVVLAPNDLPETPESAAAWHRECGRLVGAVTAAGGVGGLADDYALALYVPQPPREAVEAMAATLALAPEGSPPWTAGVVGTLDKGRDATLLALLAGAREARQAARESAVPAREWDPGDADMAPDVVIVEDDAALADLITFALETRGFSHRH